jgi:hypothetical protein
MCMNMAHYDPFEYIALSVVFALVILGWILYTRRLKTPPNVGKNEGIVMAIQEREHSHKAGKAS